MSKTQRPSMSDMSLQPESCQPMAEKHYFEQIRIDSSSMSLHLSQFEYGDKEHAEMGARS